MKSGRFALFKFVMVLLFTALMCCPLASSFAADTNDNVKRKKGLIVLVKFNGDDESTLLPREKVAELFNTKNYQGRNTGSVRDYFYDQSYGQYEMEFYVTNYVQLDETRDHFKQFDSNRATTLLRTYALDKYYSMTDTEIPNDLSYTLDYGDKVLDATLILYSGPNQGGSKGLWLLQYSPSSSTAIKKHDYRSKRYIAGNIGFSTDAEHALGGLIHEIGHLTTGPLDYYTAPYSLGYYCLMGMGAYADQSYTPVPINPLNKIKAGWAKVRDINANTYEQNTPVNANDSVFIRYQNPANSQEYFLIQNINKSVKWGKGYPAEGIAVWHVHEGHASNQDGTGIPRLFIAGVDSTIKYNNTDLLAGNLGRNASANDDTNPSTRWWDGTPSGLMISNVSEVGPEMRITIGNDAGSVVIETTEVVNTGKDATGISLQWTATTGKTYQVYRKRHTDADFTFLATAPQGASSYKDTTAVPGVLYDYYVREQ